MDRKSENSCCLLFHAASGNVAQGILCCLANLDLGPLQAQFGLLTCHHVIPSKAETPGWTIYYGPDGGREYHFRLEQFMISNFYSCCNKESGNEHFDEVCHINLDYTLIVFNEDAPIHDIELLNLVHDYDSLDKLEDKPLLRCRIFQRLPNKLSPVPTFVYHENYWAYFHRKESKDMSTFVIAYPNEIKGHGSSGCPIVFYADGFPRLLGMHTTSYRENGHKYSAFLYLENTSTIFINKFVERQFFYTNLDFDSLLQIFLKYNIGNRDNGINFYKEKCYLWMIANHLCKMNKDVKSRKEIKKFCKYNYY